MTSAGERKTRKTETCKGELQLQTTESDLGNKTKEDLG